MTSIRKTKKELKAKKNNKQENLPEIEIVEQGQKESPDLQQVQADLVVNVDRKIEIPKCKSFEGHMEELLEETKNPILNEILPDIIEGIW